MNPIGYPKLHPVGSDPALYERRSDRSGSQQEPTCNRSDRSECFVGPTLSRSTRSRGVDRARADRLHTLVLTPKLVRKRYPFSEVDLLMSRIDGAAKPAVR